MGIRQWRNGLLTRYRCTRRKCLAQCWYYGASAYYQRVMSDWWPAILTALRHDTRCTCMPTSRWNTPQIPRSSSPFLCCREYRCPFENEIGTMLKWIMPISHDCFCVESWWFVMNHAEFSRSFLCWTIWLIDHGSSCRIFVIVFVLDDLSNDEDVPCRIFGIIFDYFASLNDWDCRLSGSMSNLDWRSSIITTWQSVLDRLVLVIWFDPRWLTAGGGARYLGLNGKQDKNIRFALYCRWVRDVLAWTNMFHATWIGFS